MISLEPYHQTYTYDTGNNLTNLSHQANSSTWQQTIAIHPNNNRSTVLSDVVFVCFSELVKRVIVVPI
jgi:hypothetical protein